MKRRVISVLLLVVPLLFSALFVERQASAQLTSEVEEQQDILRTARQRAAEARERAHRLREQAVEARASAERTAAERAALQAQVDEAEADLAAANARLALLDSRLATRRERLSQMQGPLVGLVASLQSYARRPAILAISEPSSISEVVHLRAIMTAIEPTIEARTEQVREEIARARLYRKQEATANRALYETRQRLADRRSELAAQEAGQRARFAQISEEVQAERERAFGLGERARDIIESIESREADSDLAERLAALPAPKWSIAKGAAGTNGAHDVRTTPVYRLPIEGTLLTGLGEASDSGFRAKGLTVRGDDMATVVAPAGGRIAFAGRYRSYGNIVIIDHGAGWTTLLTGLGTLAVRKDERVAMGARIGVADDAQEGITVELRRGGRPVDLIALLG